MFDNEATFAQAIIIGPLIGGVIGGLLGYLTARWHNRRNTKKQSPLV